MDIRGRARDHAKNLAGRSLLLQRLAQLARARLHLVEQPHVLDRDHRLVGEGLHQPDLRSGERLDLASPTANDSDRLSLSNDRNRHEAPVSERALQHLAGAGVVVEFRQHVLKVHPLAVHEGPAHYEISLRRTGEQAVKGLRFAGRKVADRHKMQQSILVARDSTEMRLA